MEENFSTLEYIRSLISDCRWDDAMELAQKASEEEPENIDYNWELARIFIEMGNWESAISNLELVSNNTRNHLVYFTLGEAYQSNGQIDRAIGAYLKSIMLNEKFPLPYKKLGILFLGRNDILSAIEYFEDYLKLDVAQSEKEQVRKILDRIKNENSRNIHS